MQYSHPIHWNSLSHCTLESSPGLGDCFPNAAGRCGMPQMKDVIEEGRHDVPQKKDVMMCLIAIKAQRIRRSDGACGCVVP